MADRKVLVKYYPPDFDFDKLQAKKKVLRIQQQQLKRRRGDVYDLPQKRHKNKVMNVRMMYPFTLKCGTCSEFIYVGTKFNSRVEKVEGEDYLGIIKWRFYGRCPHCRGEICFKTDPQNCDYVLEWGGTRMCDPLRDQALAAERMQKEEEEKIAMDKICQVEASRQGLQQEVLALEQLAELRRLNRRLLDRTAASDAALDFLRQRRIKDEDMEGNLAQEWTEMEKDELKFFRAARELDSDPESVEEEISEGTDHQPADSSAANDGDAHSNGGPSGSIDTSSSIKGNDSATSGNSSSSSSSSRERRVSISSSSTSTSVSHAGSSEANTEGSSTFICRKPGDPGSAIHGDDSAADTGGSSRPASSTFREPTTASSKGNTLNFGLGVCVAAPKLLVVRKQQPQPSGDCSALLGDYGSSSSDEGESR
ncbi:hypothetical protein, conserved [Eimeria necatrix]|uniref:Splicing factor YJU2 n=1 Tax=Eimeria necatrix TaxID=51315 RepID=U6MQU7_9EIME|nr:hypothetical protein, conserved [Eimeria necatrix]CDJ66401.1 hypothetical protein, conserved [Eimeria necatrix]